MSLKVVSVDEYETLELDSSSNSKSKRHNGKRIIEVYLSSTITIAKIQLDDLEEYEEGEFLFIHRCG